VKPVLGLPGRNPETESWMSSLLATLRLNDTEVASYGHWRKGEAPDIAQEADRFPIAARSLVIAKSMGTMVLLAAAETGRPERAVLIGTPIDAYSDAQAEVLKSLITSLPILFVQQTNDFTGSAASLRALLGAEATILEMVGSDHVYADVDELAMLIGGWLASLDG